MRTQNNASAMASATACFHFASARSRRRRSAATTKVVGARPARSISTANMSTATRIMRLGYHRPVAIGGPSTVTARSPIAAPKTRRPMLSSSGHVARSHARDAADVVVAAEPKPGEADGDQDDRGPNILRALDTQRHGWVRARDGLGYERASLFDSAQLWASQMGTRVSLAFVTRPIARKAIVLGLVARASCDLLMLHHLRPGHR